MNKMLEKPSYTYNKPLPKLSKRRRKTNQASSFVRSFLITLIVLTSLAAIAYRTDFKNAFSDVMATLTGKQAGRMELNLPFSPRRQNILFMGVDVASNAKDPFKGNRSDTMLLISIAPYGKDVKSLFLVIPRFIFQTEINRIKSTTLLPTAGLICR